VLRPQIFTGKEMKSNEKLGVTGCSFWGCKMLLEDTFVTGALPLTH